MNAHRIVVSSYDDLKFFMDIGDCDEGSTAFVVDMESMQATELRIVHIEESCEDDERGDTLFLGEKKIRSGVQRRVCNGQGVLPCLV